MMVRTQCLRLPGMAIPLRAEDSDDVGEVLRRGGEVEEAVALGAELRVKRSASSVFSAVVACVVVEVHREVLTRSTNGSSLDRSLDAAALTMPSFMSAAKVVSERRRATPTTAKSLGSRPDCSR
jgi:hypothetical protein